jgi:hypothetical protein
VMPLWAALLGWGQRHDGCQKTWVFPKGFKGNRHLHLAIAAPAHFCGNGFSQASVHDATLSSPRFNFANLSDVNFSSAICTQTDFNNSEVGYQARLAKA